MIFASTAYMLITISDSATVHKFKIHVEALKSSHILVHGPQGSYLF